VGKHGKTKEEKKNREDEGTKNREEEE